MAVSRASELAGAGPGRGCEGARSLTGPQCGGMGPRNGPKISIRHSPNMTQPCPPSEWATDTKRVIY